MQAQYRAFATMSESACHTCKGVTQVLRIKDRKSVNCPECCPRPKFFVKHVHKLEWARMERKDGITTVPCGTCSKSETYKI